MCISFKNHHTTHIYLCGHVGNEQHLNAVYMKHYTDNAQNLCGLIYITLYGKFPSPVHYVQPVCDTNTMLAMWAQAIDFLHYHLTTTHIEYKGNFHPLCTMFSLFVITTFKRQYNHKP